MFVAPVSVQRVSPGVVEQLQPAASRASSSVSAGQFYQPTFSLLCWKQGRICDYATSAVCFHVGVAVDKHSTLLIRVCVK